MSGGSWMVGLIGIGVLIFLGRQVYLANLRKTEALQPWTWPQDLRATAEDMARLIDPTPKRILPPDEKSSIIAQVATTREALARLTADKPHAWPWALFASVLLQRRNAVGPRLRNVVSGYQPRPGMPRHSGRAYSRIARQSMTAIGDVLSQIEQFLRSPAFNGAFGEIGEEKSADSEAIESVANRLMDYHEALLVQAENCVQTPVEPDVMVFVQDMGAFTLLPLMGYQRFIETMCARVGEAQDLLPYSKGGVIQLEDVTLEADIPDGLMPKILEQFKRFNG